MGRWAMRAILAGAMLCAGLLWAAEKAPEFPNSTADAKSPLGSGLTKGLRDKEEFNWARSAGEKGDYRSAAALYETYLRRYAGSPREDEARYALGRCYLELGDYHRALGSFQAYLRKFPEGKQVDPMVSTLRQVREELARKVETREDNVRRISARAEAVEVLIEKGSVSADRYAELGDLYWELGRYPDAQKAYQKALEVDPHYWKTHDAGQRIYFDAHGRLLVRPPTLSDEELFSGLVRVKNYTARVLDLANDIEGDRRAYLVSGLAVNTGQEPLSNVQLEITLVDLFGNIMDTRTVNLGHLRPNAQKPFAVRFYNFDDSNVNVFNVDRVKFTASYD